MAAITGASVPLLQNDYLASQPANLSGFSPEQLKQIQAIITMANSPPRAVYTFSDGSTYVGEMRNGLPHGQGKKTYPLTHNRTSYEGSFVNGVEEGAGTLIFKTGGKYVGEFSNNSQHGQGRWDSGRDRSYQLGKFENGFLVEGTSYESYTIRSDGIAVPQYLTNTGTFKNNELWNGTQKDPHTVWEFENGKRKYCTCGPCLIQ